MKGIVSYSLRLDEDLHDKVRKIALKEVRSINNQYEYIIRQFVEQYEKDNGKVS